MKNIERIVVFGDSLSDIGVKRNTPTGMLARLFGLARINKIGRFSDNKNWTDFIWEWSGNESLVDAKSPDESNKLTAYHLSLENSRHGAKNNSLSYCNYATGGAVADTAVHLANKIGLTTFEQQVNQYKQDLQKTPNDKPITNLFIVWFGLNDVVTDAKDISKIEAVVQRQKDLCNQIGKETKLHNQASECYFIVINLPDPQDAIRFVDQTETEKIKQFQQAAIKFNGLLKTSFPTEENKLVLIDVYTVMKQNSYSLNVIRLDQARGVKIDYYNENDQKSIPLSEALSNLLRSFPVENNPELKDFIGVIDTNIKKALMTDNEIILHKNVSSALLERLPAVKRANPLFTKKLIAILQVCGLFINRVEFVIKYYKTIKQKHLEEINKIQNVIDDISSKNNLLTALHNDLNNFDTTLYDTLADILVRVDNNSTFKKLLNRCIAQKFGFVATSDKAHPTEAVYSVLATIIVLEFTKNFPDLSLGESLVSNATGNLFGDSILAQV